MKTFQGRVVTPGCAQAEALVSHGGLNTLASFQKSLQFGDKTAKCGDQNNPDLYGKPMAGKALCLPQTIGSTTGGLVLYCACAMDRQPASSNCLDHSILFSSSNLAFNSTRIVTSFPFSAASIKDAMILLCFATRYNVILIETTSLSSAAS